MSELIHYANTSMGDALCGSETGLPAAWEDEATCPACLALLADRSKRSSASQEQAVLLSTRPIATDRPGVDPEKAAWLVRIRDLRVGLEQAGLELGKRDLMALDWVASADMIPVKVMVRLIAEAVGAAESEMDWPGADPEQAMESVRIRYLRSVLERAGVMEPSERDLVVLDWLAGDEIVPVQTLVGWIADDVDVAKPGADYGRA